MKKSTLLLLFILSLAVGGVHADPVGPDAVKELYERVKSTIEHPTPENPFYLEAENRHKVESGEAVLVFPQQINDIADTLSSPNSWCEILPLHINVKACTYSKSSNVMTIYLGRKFYQDPEDAYQLEYNFSTIKQDDYFAFVAVAEEGPLGTSDYHIEFEVIPVAGKSFGRIHVSDHQSWISSKAMHIYLSTKGADKQGIKVVGHDEQGHPIYSKGESAVAERNLLRYYFAFAAYFDSATEPDANKRHEKQMKYWYDQTEKFPQLHEISREEYLDEKRRERVNQIALQNKRSQ
jgi:hypothetical protein